MDNADQYHWFEKIMSIVLTFKVFACEITFNSFIRGITYQDEKHRKQLTIKK